MTVAGRLAGRVAIVTGAGSAGEGEGIGNGRATAIVLSRAGARVAVVDSVPAAADATSRLIGEEGGEAMVVVCDVSDDRSCQAGVGEILARWGTVQVLVNNVGILGPAGTAAEVDPQRWDQAMRVNVTSMMLMARYCAAAMREAGGGAIVNMASTAGLTGGHPNLFYPTSKGAVVNMTRAMAAQHGREGIRVNCVAPGMVYTPMVAAGGMPEEVRAARRERSLLGIEGTAWDVANAVLFLVSDEARWITGVVLPVDGGATAAYPQPPRDLAARPG